MKRRVELLGLAISDPFAAAFTAATTLVVLWMTMARWIGPYDGGELAVAAYELGLGHPPGQPLHALLGFLASHIPGIAPAVGLAALSAVPAALTVVPAWALAERLVPEPRHRIILPVTLFCAALHGVAWEGATRIEVYPLAAFFGIMAIARACALHDAPLDRRAAVVVGLFLGLSACANPVVAFIAGLASLALLVRRRDGIAGRLAAAVAGGLVGLAPYLYLFAIAGRDDAFVWGGLTSRAEVLHFLGGRDFDGNLQVPLSLRLAQAAVLVDYLASARGYVAILVAGLLGVLTALRAGRSAVGVASIVAFLVALAFVASNRVFRVGVPDYLGYFALPFSLLGVCATASVDAAMRRTPAGALLLVAIVVSTLLGSPVAWQRSRAGDDIAQRVAVAILDEAPVDSIVVVESDHLAGPLLFVQRVERRRTDVVVVVRGLMSSGWYVRLLARQHPDLRPYAVRGPGARDGRIRRMIDANGRRSVRFESLRIAESVGLAACPGGITLRSGRDCVGDLRPSLGPLAAIGRRTWSLPSGAIDGRTLLPSVSYRIGLDLYRLGMPREAYVALVLGLPGEYRTTPLASPASIHVDDRFIGPEPTFRRESALGDPARNAFVAATILSRSGQSDSAFALVSTAARDGMPEAIELLRRASR